MTKILIVGGGAVGQVYGYHLQRGGADITFLLKPKYVESARKQGFVLYDARKKGERREFRHFECCSGVEELEKQASEGVEKGEDCVFDQIWITTASDSLYEGDWLKRLLSCQRVVQENKTVLVYMQPDLTSREKIEEIQDASSVHLQLVHGVIQFLSYQSPLPDENDAALIQQQGVAYAPVGWMQPFSLFGPRNETTKAIQSLLRDGGVRVALTNDSTFYYARVAALSVPVMACLETCADWTLTDFRKRSVQKSARQAVREALRVTCAYHKKSFWTVLYEPMLYGFCLTVAYASVFMRQVPIERFLKFHFTKVRSQTVQMLEHYCEQGECLGVKTPALAQLLSDLSAPDQ